MGHLAWKFLENCQQRLNPGGWLIINQWAANDGKPLGAALLMGSLCLHITPSLLRPGAEAG